MIKMIPPVPTSAVMMMPTPKQKIGFSIESIVGNDAATVTSNVRANDRNSDGNGNDNSIHRFNRNRSNDNDSITYDDANSCNNSFNMEQNVHIEDQNSSNGATSPPQTPPPLANLSSLPFADGMTTPNQSSLPQHHHIHPHPHQQPQPQPHPHSHPHLHAHHQHQQNILPTGHQYPGHLLGVHPLTIAQHQALHHHLLLQQQQQQQQQQYHHQQQQQLQQHPHLPSPQKSDITDIIQRLHNSAAAAANLQSVNGNYIATHKRLSPETTQVSSTSHPLKRVRSPITVSESNAQNPAQRHQPLHPTPPKSMSPQLSHSSSPQPPPVLLQSPLTSPPQQQQQQQHQLQVQTSSPVITRDSESPYDKHPPVSVSLAIPRSTTPETVTSQPPTPSSLPPPPPAAAPSAPVPVPVSTMMPVTEHPSIPILVPAVPPSANIVRPFPVAPPVGGAMVHPHPPGHPQSQQQTMPDIKALPPYINAPPELPPHQHNPHLLAAAQFQMAAALQAGHVLGPAAAAAAAAAGLPPHPGPFLTPSGMPRDTYPLYPWLLSRHGRIFPHRFPGNFLLQPFRKPKRIRTAFSPSQLLKLEHAFESNQYVVGAERKALAQSLNLSETQVKVWFQNRRTKHKRMQQEDEKGGNNSNERTRRNLNCDDDGDDDLDDDDVDDDDDDDDCDEDTVGIRVGDGDAIGDGSANCADDDDELIDMEMDDHDVNDCPSDNDGLGVGFRTKFPTTDDRKLFGTSQ